MHVPHRVLLLSILIRSFFFSFFPFLYCSVCHRTRESGEDKKNASRHSALDVGKITRKLLANEIHLTITGISNPRKREVRRGSSSNQCGAKPLMPHVIICLISVGSLKGPINNLLHTYFSHFQLHALRRAHGRIFHSSCFSRSSFPLYERCKAKQPEDADSTFFFLRRWV